MSQGTYAAAARLPLTAIFIFCLFLIPLSALAAESPVGPIGEVSSFVGKLLHSKDGETWREVTPGELPLSVQSGDWLKTEKGRAQVSYPDGTILRLMENTHVRVAMQKPEGQDKVLRDIFTKFGHVWTDVKPGKGIKTQFRSPTAIAGIRGTSFDWIFVEALGRTTMDMDQGRVFLRSVRDGEPFGPGTDLSGGLRSSVHSGSPPLEPRDYPQYPPPMVQLYNQLTHGQQPDGPLPPTPEEIAQRIASGQNPTDLVFEAISLGLDPVAAVGQVIESAVAQGLPLAQIIQQIAGEAYTRGVPADSVALVIVQSAAAGAAASGQDVGQVLGEVGRALGQGLVEGAAQNGDDVAEAARQALEGALIGAQNAGVDPNAVQDAVNQGVQDAAPGTETPDSGEGGGNTGTTVSTLSTIPTTLTTQTTGSTTSTGATTTGATTTGATTTAAPTTAAPTTTATTQTTQTTATTAPPVAMPPNGSFESGNTSYWDAAGDAQAWQSSPTIQPTDGDYVGVLAKRDSAGGSAGDLDYLNLQKPSDDYQYLVLDYAIAYNGVMAANITVTVSDDGGQLDSYSDGIIYSTETGWITLAYDVSAFAAGDSLDLEVYGCVISGTGYSVIDWLRWTTDMSTFQQNYVEIVLSPSQ